MALPIITADQTLLVQAIIVYLYADPGLGKSSMGFTAEKAISFDFDRGAHRTGELRRGAVVQVQQWSDVANLTPQDLAPYKTVVIDTQCLNALKPTCYLRQITVKKMVL
ncbi:hypothetical protein BANRA_00007 [Acinetobacter baumannii]|nr:hypothetical protein BANRA_00007 [Acinetobacter baumannii]